MEELLSLAVQEVLQGQKVLITARGNSMFPLIRDRVDKIVLAPLTTPIRKGNIVLTIQGESYVLHRVIEISGDIVTLRGDGNPFGVECVPINSIVGEAVAIIRCSSREIHKGSLSWWCFQHLWPKSSWCRKVILGVSRRIKLR